MSEKNQCQLMSVQSRMLMMAARENMPKTIRALLQEGADIEAKTSDGYTALLLSAWFGHLENIKILIESGTNINAVSDKEGGTALLMAAQKGFFEIAKYLLENGASPTIEDKDKDTPLSVAEKMNHQNIVKLLTQ